MFGVEKCTSDPHCQYLHQTVAQSLKRGRATKPNLNGVFCELQSVCGKELEKFPEILVKIKFINIHYYPGLVMTGPRFTYARVSTRLRQLLRNDHLVLSVLAIAVGAVVGISVVGFREAIDFFSGHFLRAGRLLR